MTGHLLALLYGSAKTAPSIFTWWGLSYIPCRLPLWSSPFRPSSHPFIPRFYFTSASSHRCLSCLSSCFRCFTFRCGAGRSFSKSGDRVVQAWKAWKKVSLQKVPPVVPSYLVAYTLTVLNFLSDSKVCLEWTSWFLLLHNFMLTWNNTASTLSNTAAITEEVRTGARVSGIAKYAYKTYLEKPLAFVGSLYAGCNIYISTASMSDFLCWWDIFRLASHHEVKVSGTFLESS